jgi:trans-aconitate methyltransferase
MPFHSSLAFGNVHGVGLGFGGEVAQLYRTYRRGYPRAVIDELVDRFGRTSADVAVDLGCGTGQLTLPLAFRLRAVIGVDPEPDMLAIARGEPSDGNVTWVNGTDADLPALAALMGTRSVGLVTAATALHWMDVPALLDATFPLVRRGGGFAVVTNGKPLWMLDTAWSQSLAAFLESWTGHRLTNACGTNGEAQQRYRSLLERAGFAVSSTFVTYSDDLSIDQLVGGVLSTFSEQRMPPDRALFAGALAEAVGDGPFTEVVNVSLLCGVRP